MDNLAQTIMLATMPLTIAAATFLIMKQRRQNPDKPEPHEPTDRPAEGTQAPVFDPLATRIFMKQSLRPPVKRLGGATIAEDTIRLIGLGGAQRGRNVTITSQGVTIGRSASCDIQLTDSRVSARHAWVGIVADKVILRDLGSTNGTFINADLNTPVHEAELHPNDTLVFGGHMGDQFRLAVSTSQ